MREKAIWAVLHKSWEESMKHERLLKTLLMNISGEQLWSASELDLRHQFPDVPAAGFPCQTAQFRQRRQAVFQFTLDLVQNGQQLPEIFLFPAVGRRQSKTEAAAADDDYERTYQF